MYLRKSESNGVFFLENLKFKVAHFGNGRER